MGWKLDWQGAGLVLPLGKEARYTKKSTAAAFCPAAEKQLVGAIEKMTNDSERDF